MEICNKYMKNGMPIEIFMEKFHCNRFELMGILELCKMYDKDITIATKEGIEIFDKPLSKSITKNSKLPPIKTIMMKREKSTKILMISM